MTESFDLQSVLIFVFRLSNESDSNSVSLGSSDWLELVQALDNIQREAGE